MKHSVKVSGNTRFGKHVAHVDKQGQCDHREPLHQCDAGVERHGAAAAAPQKSAGYGADDTDGGKNPLSCQHEHAHGSEEQQGNGFMRKRERNIKHGGILSFPPGKKKVAGRQERNRPAATAAYALAWADSGRGNSRPDLRSDSVFFSSTSTLHSRSSRMRSGISSPMVSPFAKA